MQTNRNQPTYTMLSFNLECVGVCVDIDNQSVSRGQGQSQDEYKPGPVFPEVVIPPATE